MKYECHITIDPVSGSELDSFESMCAFYRFKVAKLLKDNGLPSDKDQFATGHDVDYTSLEGRMVLLCRELKMEGYVIRRYKIEEILLDSRMGDTWQLI